MQNSKITVLRSEWVLYACICCQNDGEAPAGAASTYIYQLQHEAPLWEPPWCLSHLRSPSPASLNMNHSYWSIYGYLLSMNNKSTALVLEPVSHIRDRWKKPWCIECRWLFGVPRGSVWGGPDAWVPTPHVCLPPSSCIGGNGHHRPERSHDDRGQYDRRLYLVSWCIWYDEIPLISNVLARGSSFFGRHYLVRAMDFPWHFSTTNYSFHEQLSSHLKWKQWKQDMARNSPRSQCVGDSDQRWWCRSRSHGEGARRTVLLACTARWSSWLPEPGNEKLPWVDIPNV